MSKKDSTPHTPLETSASSDKISSSPKIQQKYNEINNKSNKAKMTGKNKTKLNNINEVPVASKLVTLHNSVRETELISTYPNTNLNSIIDTHEKSDIMKSRKMNLHYTPKTFSKMTQLSSSVNKHDEMEVSFIETRNADERTVTKDKKVHVKEIKNKAIPAKPMESLPSDLEISIKNDKIKLTSKTVENNLIFQQLSIDRMQSTLADGNSMNSTRECIINNKKKLTVKQQIPSQISHNDTNVQILVSKMTKKNTDLQNVNNAIHQNTSKANEINVKYDKQNQLSASIRSNTRKRGRPRKITDNCMEQNTPKTLEDDDTTQKNLNIIESTSRSKRHINKTMIITDMSGLSDESDTSDTVEDKSFVKTPNGRGQGRGRRRGRSRGKNTVHNSLDREYIPKASKRKNISQLETITNNEKVIDDTNAAADLVANTATDSNTSYVKKDMQLVTCAKCNQQIPKRQWSSHILHRHNNMAWQENEEPLDFENDIKLLKKVLACAIKRRKTLNCEKCKTSKRSVNGFISHMQFCGKTHEEKQALMMECPICNAVMMPSSMEMHERYHRQQQQNKTKEVPIILERAKRKAAEKAMPKILEFTESEREQNPSTARKAKLNMFKDVIQLPELKKKIPAVWKGIWKKELASKRIVSCRQVGCTYTCSSYEDICEHYSQCNFTPQENFMCKICKFDADSKDKIESHVAEFHPMNLDKGLDKHSDFEKDSSDDSTIESDTKRKYRLSNTTQMNSDNTRIFSKMAFLNKEIAQSPQSTEAYKPTFRWTLEFELENYELELFKNYMPNIFTLLKNDDAAKYLPELTTSMAFKHVDTNSSENMKKLNDDNWKRLNIFESGIYEAMPTFFVGGPIWAIAWLPIPSPMYTKNPSQYIAISTHPTMESKYAVGKSYSGQNIIQIWDVGHLNNEDNSPNKPPVIAYAIAHDSGTVWCLEWCPSGCYQDSSLFNYKAEENKFRRMGLLAAACSDGCVNIYSLPFADELKFEKTEFNSWPIYKTDPVVTLVVNFSMYDKDKQNWQCTKLSWTRERGHNFIAAGFTNGYIALWHLTTVSPLLLNVRRNTRFINACQHFFAHHNAVTMVALVPYHNRRFLASASLDRMYKFWDLENTSAPQECSKKGIIVDGVWMLNWPCSVISFDDALGFKCTHSYIMPVRQYGYKYCPILATNAPTYSIAVSDYANGIAHGTLAGEIVSIFPHQLLYAEKLLPKKRQLNSFIKTIDLLKEEQHMTNRNNKNENKKDSKDYHYMPETYNECKDRFGIIFHDNLVDIKEYVRRGKQEDTLYNDKLMSIPVEQYPFTSVNKIAWNPNAWSYLCLMGGYQNGLMRLLTLKHMSLHSKMETLLLSHVESVLAKRNTSAQEM